MQAYRYLTTPEVLALHRSIMEDTGSVPGVRDEGLLESAVMRPRMAAHYEAADLVSQAATLIAGIAQVHAFVDGNKRTATVAGIVFLQLNGLWYGGDPLELAREVESIVTRPDGLESAIERFAAWLRPHLEPAP